MTWRAEVRCPSGLLTSSSRIDCSSSRLSVRCCILQASWIFRGAVLFQLNSMLFLTYGMSSRCWMELGRISPLNK
ncbi:hypothetical protein BpHYR1_018202 [Brachionus plicatilis]|uniref:Uncharacterized protein n=1 Tax=Brachionus plicatilis TaxID=10195 RepID=A0A3M7QIG4_BRAPC|nr:hypothetical protein BpHYR1_018202 [Brachionus plicatilis]